MIDYQRRVVSGHNKAYHAVRHDVVASVPKEARRILDIGCSTGRLGSELKQRLPGVLIHGVEPDSEAANEAKQIYDDVANRAVEDAFRESPIKDSDYDVVVTADVLEHLVDPLLVLKQVRDHTRIGGTVIISIPNVRHWTVVATLVFRGQWPVEDRGIHDRTHLHFFCLSNAIVLLEQAALKPVSIVRTLRFVSRPSRTSNLLLERLRLRNLIERIPVVREFLTFQYLLVAKREQ